MTKKYYIGMHSTDDKEDGYLGSGYRLHRSLRKHGRENHTREILEDCSERGRDFLRERERQMITTELLSDPMCLNIAKGGGYDDFVGEKISKAKIGTKRTAEARLRMSLAKKGKPGPKLSDVAKAKISKLHKGRIFTEEHRKKLGAAIKKFYAAQFERNLITLICFGCGIEFKQKKSAYVSKRPFHSKDCKMSSLNELKKERRLSLKQKGIERTQARWKKFRDIHNIDLVCAGCGIIFSRSIKRNNVKRPFHSLNCRENFWLERRMKSFREKKKKVMSFETKMKLSKAFKGKPRTDEVKRKISASVKATWKDRRSSK